MRRSAAARFLLQVSITIRRYTTKPGADHRLLLNSTELPRASNSYSVELQQLLSRITDYRAYMGG